MQVVRLVVFFLALVLALIAGAYISAVISQAQVINPDLRPDLQRALRSRQNLTSKRSRPNAYQPARSLTQQTARTRRPQLNSDRLTARAGKNNQNIPPTTPIPPGTNLNRVLHTSQLSLTSSAGTDEQFFDRNLDLMADERTTFDSSGGSFDIALGRSGARYEVFSATLNNRNVGVLVVALDTNGDFVINQSSTYDLQRDFSLPSAAAVVSGTGLDGREFVVVSSSGYYNSQDPNDPNNEPSPGVILLVRDPFTGGFDNSRSRELVRVGDNQLFNANGLALLPNNEVLIADFHSFELRVIRDTNHDGFPDTLSSTPYYSYRFSDDAPLDVAVNSRGVVFSHSVGNDSLMLAIYDDNGDGRGDRDEVVVEGLSIDNNLFLHGLTVDQKGAVYVIEDATSTFDGDEGNGGIARIDAFPDPNMDGFLMDGSVFAQADFDDLALSGLGFGAPPPARKIPRKTWRTTNADQPTIDPVVIENPADDTTLPSPILLLNLPLPEVEDSDGEGSHCQLPIADCQFSRLLKVCAKNRSRLARLTNRQSKIANGQCLNEVRSSFAAGFEVGHPSH